MKGSVDYSSASGAPTNGSVTNAMLANMAAKTFKGRKTNSTGAPEDVTIAELLTLLGVGGVQILQAVQVVKKDTFSMNSQTFADVTGLSVTLGALASAASRVLVFGVTQIGCTGTSYQNFALKVLRDSTDIAIADANGTQPRAWFGSNGTGIRCMHSVPFTYIDSPGSTSAPTYKVQIRKGNVNDAGAIWVNRNVINDANADSISGVSTLIAVELSA